MVRFSRVWRTLLRMGHPQVRWLVWLMTQDGLMPSQFQGDEGGAGALPRNRVECAFLRGKDLWRWCANEPTARTAMVPRIPRRVAPTRKPPCRCRGGSSVGTCAVGWDIAAS